MAQTSAPGRNRAKAGFRIGKRCVDLTVGGALAVLTLPLVVLMTLGVLISLRCWPFFSHERPGRDGAPMRVYKLRTLPKCTPAYADKLKIDIEHMPLPWLCRAMRRSHLDELPQLFLVVTGKMSLVGPRPTQHPVVEPVEAEFSALRTSVQQGCTGLWQISVGAVGRITDSPEFDIYYVRNATIRLDLWILYRTAGQVLGVTNPVALTEVPQWLTANLPGARRGLPRTYPVTSLDTSSVYPRQRARDSDFPIEPAALGTD